MLRLDGRSLAALAQRLPVPSYDRASVTTGIVHVGVGGFHRAHQAVYHDRLMNAGASLEWGICGVGVMPGDERMRDVLRAQDGLYTLITRTPDGADEARVIGSIVDYLFAPEDPEAVIARMAAPQTRIVSLTVTEGGYGLDPGTGRFDPAAPDVARDLAGTGPPRTVFGLVVEALRRRRAEGREPFTVLSCDNLPGNGDVARRAFGAFAAHLDRGLGEWVQHETPFPNSVVDRITPATTDADRAALRDGLGIDDGWPVVCEPFSQWVIEDTGARDWPPYADAGAELVADPRPYELMKLRLLNAGHQTLGHFGLLCGHRLVHEAAQDPQLRAFLEGYLDQEAVPTLTEVPEPALEAFRGPLLGRFANPGVRDTLERLVADASDRIPVFLVPVIRERLAAGQDVARAAAVVAAWTRALDGVDDDGEPFAMRDRRSDDLRARAARRGEDPLALIGDGRLFGDLAGDERFAAAYRRALASLDERGARATLAALA